MAKNSHVVAAQAAVAWSFSAITGDSE